MRDKIILSGMEFYGYHGVMPEEKSLGQKFIIDVEMYMTLKEAGQTDDLAKTVNYAEVFEMIKEILQGPPQNLIETVAEKIAQQILSNYNPELVLVRVKKPQAPINGTFDYVGVEIIRGQQ